MKNTEPPSGIRNLETYTEAVPVRYSTRITDFPCERASPLIETVRRGEPNEITDRREKNFLFRGKRVSSGRDGTPAKTYLRKGIVAVLSARPDGITERPMKLEAFNSDAERPNGGGATGPRKNVKYAFCLQRAEQKSRAPYQGNYSGRRLQRSS